MKTNAPLPEKVRPEDLTDFIGQPKIVGKEGIITTLLNNYSKNPFFPSLIFWGPPGCGKTTLARIIAKELKIPFYEYSAVNTSVKDIKDQLKNHSQTSKNLSLLPDESYKMPGKPIVFIDEIHRFNKAQQDAFLHLVETGEVILIGATTENPSFEVIAPLLSRCRVIVLSQHSEEDLQKIINRGLKELNLKIDDNANTFLKIASNGDARVALNVLEIASNLTLDKKINLKNIETALQRKQLNFDLKGEEFYNTISALHKCMRGSDPDAALYYLARMLESGQDPLYIARRLVRFASEDIGLNDQNALNLAVSTFLACERLGMPECNVILAHLVVYLAKASKSNKIYLAYGKAAEDVKNFGNLPIPLHIRNAPTKLMKNIGYGKDYDYYHSPEGKKKDEINYFPDKLKNRKYL